MMINLQDTKMTFAEKMKDSELRLFSGSAPLKASQVITAKGGDVDDDDDDDYYGNFDEDNDAELDMLEDEEGDDDDEEDDEEFEDEGIGSEEDDETGDSSRSRGRRKATAERLAKLENLGFGSSEQTGDVQYAESDSDLGDFDDDQQNLDDEEEEGGVGARWKDNILEKAAESFSNSRKVNLMTKIYGKDGNGVYEDDEGDDDDEDGIMDVDGLFKTKRKPKAPKPSLKLLDTCRTETLDKDLIEWDDEEVRSSR
jgi:ribosome biogenesis protein BMS1